MPPPGDFKAWSFSSAWLFSSPPDGGGPALPSYSSPVLSWAQCIYLLPPTLATCLAPIRAINSHSNPITSRHHSLNSHSNPIISHLNHSSHPISPIRKAISLPHNLAPIRRAVSSINTHQPHSPATRRHRRSIRLRRCHPNSNKR